MAQEGGAPAAASDAELSDRIGRYWTNFARSGDPNDTVTPPWPVYRGAGTMVMRFAATSQAMIEEGTNRLRFIQSFRTASLLPERWRRVKGRLSEPLAASLAKAILFISWLQSSLRRARN